LALTVLSPDGLLSYTVFNGKKMRSDKKGNEDELDVQSIAP
jgi:hypothetical protein